MTMVLYGVISHIAGDVSPLHLCHAQLIQYSTCTLGHVLRRRTLSVGFSWLDLGSNYFLHTMVSKKCSSRTSLWHCTGRHVWVPCQGLK